MKAKKQEMKAEAKQEHVCACGSGMKTENCCGSGSCCGGM